jgi:amino acid-DNA transferase-like protein
MSYPKLDIYKFGEQLLLTKDIDPVYVALDNSGWDKVTKARWCLAYWCLYNAGVASYIAESPGDFWALLGAAARNDCPAPTGERWPRGKERRHWRGKQALASLADLQSKYNAEPEGFYGYISTPEGLPLPQIGVMTEVKWNALRFATVANRVTSHVGFGPWMAFKIADMLEQVFHVPVDFDNAAVFMFKDPREAAIRFWRAANKLPENAKPRNENDVINQVVAHLQEHFAQYDAPTGKRKVGLQEIETILCKWKSHQNGHYPFTNDIAELANGLQPWIKHSKLAEELYELRGLHS